MFLASSRSFLLSSFVKLLRILELSTLTDFDRFDIVTSIVPRVVKSSLSADVACSRSYTKVLLLAESFVAGAVGELDADSLFFLFFLVEEVVEEVEEVEEVVVDFLFVEEDEEVEAVFGDLRFLFFFGIVVFFFPVLWSNAVHSVTYVKIIKSVRRSIIDLLIF